MRQRFLYALPAQYDFGRDDASISVVVGEARDIVRRSLRLLLDGELGLRVVGEASDVGAALELVREHQPHVLVLDLGLPGGSSFDSIRRLRSEAPTTEIVVTTMRDDPPFARDALAAGAIGYVLKDTADEDLPDAVRRASKGERFLTMRLAGRLEAHITADQTPLTSQENDVLHLIASGTANAEIAAQLHISIHTLESHRADIHRKLGLTTRPELVRYALRRGLLAS